MKSIRELQSLEGRNAVVTGALGHLGQVLTKTLALLGANLILIDQDETRLNLFADSIKREFGSRVVCYFCDLEIESSRQKMIDSVLTEFSSMSILINNAAFVGTSSLKGWAVPFLLQDRQTWRRAIEVNLTAAFHLSQGLSSLLKQSPGASIINIGSIYGECAPDFSLYENTDLGNPAAYAVSKAGLLQLTRWLSTALAPNVRVNAISPGGILRDQPQIFREKYMAKTPMGRMGTEEDMIGAVVLLATDLSAYITGQNLKVDGGWSTW